MQSGNRFSSIDGARLRSLRLSRGWTQTELGRRAGYSERLIRKAESGGNLLLKTIDDLAAALTSDHLLVTSATLLCERKVVEADTP